MNDLGINAQTLGAILACYTIAVSAFSISGGKIVGQIGSRGALLFAGTATLVGSAGIGFFGRDPWIIGGFLAITGLATSVALPSASRIIAIRLPKRMHGLAFAVKMAAVPLATGLAGASVPLVAVRLGWRSAIAAGAIFPLVSWLFLLPQGRIDGAETREPRGRMRSDGGALIFLGGFFGSIAVGSFGGFVVVSSVRQGLDPSLVGWVIAGASALSIGVRVALGLLVDRLELNTFKLCARLIAIGAAGFALMAIPKLSVLWVAALLGYGAGWGWTAFYQMAVIQRYSLAPATATGRMATGLALGHGLGSVLFGALADRIGDPLSWIIVAIIASVGSLLMWTVGRGELSRSSLA